MPAFKTAVTVTDTPVENWVFHPESEQKCVVTSVMTGVMVSEDGKTLLPIQKQNGMLQRAVALQVYKQTTGKDPVVTPKARKGR